MIQLLKTNNILLFIIAFFTFILLGYQLNPQVDPSGSSSSYLSVIEHSQQTEISEFNDY